jgi:IS4 transposase
LGIDVDATEIAMWYCHRWNIESWFKLLKTNGHQLEKWQQTTGELILKRLIVASVATTLVFKFYSDKS